jgi:hypothetical protein
MKLACRFGWHDGSWVDVKVNYVSPDDTMSKPFLVNRAKFTCKDCGYMKMKDYIPVLTVTRYV